MFENYFYYFSSFKGTRNIVWFFLYIFEHKIFIMAKRLTPSEMFMYSTIRIECIDKSGNKSTGTGFFFNFSEDLENKTHIPVIITNKHVIENSASGYFLFTLADTNGDPLDTVHHRFEISDFTKAWILHPDPNVDLCAMPLYTIINYMTKLGKKPFIIPFQSKMIPSKEILDNLEAMEEIIMIGYPNGIWDTINNQPILRKGITATHPNKDYCGKKEFMADIASFPGSSGSPILIYNNNGYKDKNGNLFMGNARIILLGVLYAGPQHTVSGEIKILTIPTKQIPIPISTIPNNLGLIIKSERILELEKIVEKHLMS